MTRQFTVFGINYQTNDEEYFRTLGKATAKAITTRKTQNIKIIIDAGLTSGTLKEIEKNIKKEVEEAL